MKKLSFKKKYNEKVFFQQVKVFFEKAECLVSTYKSCSLKGKLPKMTMYI